jgi:peptidyl-prolyl cis-trans isomerase D
MATLEKIRSKAGILVAAVIGLALLAFVMQDLFDSKTSLFTGSKTEVGEIAGTSISYQEMEQKINELTDVYKMNTQQSNLDDKTLEGIREQAWEQIINTKVMGEEYGELGITVSPDELFELIQGVNPHPIILQVFVNPETGQFDKNLVRNFLKNKNQDPSGKSQAYWMFLENEIKTQQLNSKYSSLISKGLSVPSFIAKNDVSENSKKVDVSYFVERFNSVSDSSVKVTKGDLKKYYNDHKYLYEQITNARDIEYVTFDVLPSAEDQKATEEEVAKTKEEYVQSTDVESFVNANSDISYMDKNTKLDELPDSLKTFVSNASMGAVYGPYLENNSYKLAKLYKIVNIPDSVKARHILVRPKGQTQEDVTKAKAVADSLKTLIQKGADFAELALKYSEDRSNSQKGGDLGWFRDGSMVKSFNEAAFGSAKNEVKVIETNYGYHVLQVTDRGKEVKKYKIAYIERKISASTQTDRAIYAKAIKFASENSTYGQFNASVAKQNLAKKFASINEGERTINGLESARLLIRWAYENKQGTISEPISLNTTYVVAALTQIKKKGIAPFEQVKSDVEVAVRKEKRAEKIIEKIKAAKGNASQIQDLALKLNVPVETAEGVGFSSYTLGNSGFEPKIIAYATGMGRGKMSEPIEGNAGVYVVVVNNISEAPAGDYKVALSRLNYSIQSRVGYETYAALKKLADISDSRIKFY